MFGEVCIHFIVRRDKYVLFDPQTRVSFLGLEDIQRLSDLLSDVSRHV